MGDTQNFREELEQAINVKAEHIRTKVFPDLLSNYHLLGTCVKNLYNMLIQRSLIKADPYKLENKISKITIPETTPFNETDKAIVMGTRFSDYESVIDFICTYYKFSLEKLTIAEIKKLLAFNGYIMWDNLNPNSADVNTRVLAELLNQARINAAPLVINLIGDSISKAGQALLKINAALKEVGDYQREAYKFDIRKKLIETPFFNKESLAHTETEAEEIKKLFPKVFPKKKLYTDLIQELAREDTAPDNEHLQAIALQKLAVKMQVQKKTVKKIDTKQMLLELVLLVSALAPQYEQTLSKLDANHAVFATLRNSFLRKLVRAFRQAFNLGAEKEEYEIVIHNKKKSSAITKKIDYNVLYLSIEKKQRLLSQLASTQSAEFQKIAKANEPSILNFINKQLNENQEIMIYLDALDDFFKTHAGKENESKIKGMKMELMAMRNTIIKANQKRAEYVSLIEEQRQLKKLGIHTHAHPTV